MAGQTVLVVDERREAQAAKSALAHSSYRVLTASSGERALKILRTETPVALVLAEARILDCMPGISLAGRIRVAYPTTAVMLMTGPHHQPVDLTIPILLKPFTPSILIQRVQQVLEAAHNATESLARTFETSRARLEELAAARLSIQGSVNESRQMRTERLRARLRRAFSAPTVLVAEDDPALRYAVCRYLAQCGFQVLEASGDREALQISREHPDRIDMLVTEDCMTGMSGTGLADALLADRPRMRVLLITTKGIAQPRPALHKPFEMDDLLAHIMGALFGP